MLLNADILKLTNVNDIFHPSCHTPAGVTLPSPIAVDQSGMLTQVG